MSEESSTSLTEQNYMAKQATNESSDEGFFSGIIKKFTDNKIYIGILVGVIVLGVVLYYFYRKNKKETQIESDKTPSQENTSKQTKQELEEKELEEKELDGQELEQRQLLEYQAMQQQLAMQQQALEQQAMQKQSMQKQALQQREQLASQQQKIEHPTYTDESEESEKSEEKSGNDLKKYDLTQSEIQQITEKLKGPSLMNSEK
jgi:FtsZ-interacting cell division protein ZipA